MIKRVLLAAALLAAPLLPAGEARAQVSFGIGIGPAYPAYPVYPAYPYPYAPYPPPAYALPYAPVFPAYPAAPPAVPVPLLPAPAVPVGGARCYAGAFICPLDRTLAAGDACACPAPNGRRAWGRVGN